MRTNKREPIKILDPDLKTYFYQQIIELEPFFLPDSNIGVVVEKEGNLENSVHYFVTMVLTGGGTYVTSTAKSKSIYKAAFKAKNDILKHLYTLERKILEKEISSSSLH